MSYYWTVLETLPETVEPGNGNYRGYDYSVGSNNAYAAQWVARIAAKSFNDFDRQHRVGGPGIQQQSDD
jgi:hypothetical protein